MIKTPISIKQIASDHNYNTVAAYKRALMNIINKSKTPMHEIESNNSSNIDQDSIEMTCMSIIDI